MLFNSHLFIFVFFPCVLAVYLVLARRHVGLSIAWLTAASFWFYASGEQNYPWLLPCSVLFNYGCGIAIRRAPSRVLAKRFMVLGVVANLALLGVFKYAGFFTEQLSSLGLIAPLELDILLPVGVSFYTFTQSAYLIDTYRDGISERNFVGYALFVSYYPHLIAGPILHHKEMMPQFREPQRDRLFLSLFPGLCMLAIGMAKKVLIADPAGAVSTSVFRASELGVSFFDAWVGALAYAIQIYFDFSAYSDMAIGVSLAMGIRLPINFNSPYQSTSIIEFWRRWHITLSRFLRDYLYISLGGNRKGPRRRHLNLFLTMVLGGLWHGANWTFVVWGALHGALLFVAHAWRDLARRHPRLQIPSALGACLTFVSVVIAWIPFRAPNMQTTVGYWASMLGLNGFAIPDIGGVRTLAAKLGLPVQAAFFGSKDLPLLAAALLIAWFAPNSQEIMRQFRVGLDSPGYQALPAPGHGKLVAQLDWRTAVAFGLLLATSVRAIGGYSEFIYFQF